MLLENTVAINEAIFVSATRPKNYVYTENAPRVYDRLLYIAKGQITFLCDGQISTAVAGQCVYLPQGLNIKSHYEGEDNCTYTFIFKRLLGDLWNCIKIFDEDPAVIIAMHQCAKNETTVANSNFFLSYLYRIIYLLQAGAERENLKILPAIEALRREYQRNEKIARYARMVYMSESQFRKLFHDHLGQSPVAYRNSLRLKQVENLLFSGYTLEEAVTEAGFNSVSYYCRTAKKKKKP